MPGLLGKAARLTAYRPDEPELPLLTPPLSVGDRVLWMRHQREKSRILAPLPAVICSIGPAKVLIELAQPYRGRTLLWVFRAMVRPTTTNGD